MNRHSIYWGAADCRNDGRSRERVVGAILPIWDFLGDNSGPLSVILSALALIVQLLNISPRRER